ncbi:MAG: D-aminoacylase [Gammaproteobacteria bacterium]|nr:MAG: D-aminoacylase [Gammaproteobacteria bacterium]
MTRPDLAIRNARIVDGTGAPARTGDIAVSDGKIVAVGSVDGTATCEIDAAGQVVAPGFIDIHTHFDPQLCWDGLATPSLEHGVTTVVIGNCSLSLAPVHPGKHHKLVSMFQVIEDIKKRTFDAAVPFSWESFPEYLDHIRSGLGINVAALIGHSALRYYVMDAASQEREATDDEIQQMCDLVEEAMAAGALGISSSYVDIDENMNPVPSRYANLREKIALCKAMAKSGRGIYQVVPYFPEMEQQLANIRELGEISRAANIPCSLQPVLSSPTSPNADEVIQALEAERQNGGRVYGQVMPRCFDLNMRLSETSMLLYALPSWKAIMDSPLDERRTKFADPALRDGLVREMSEARGMSGALPFLSVGHVVSKANEQYQGRHLAEIAETEGKQIGEVILDLSNADNLETEFQLKGVINADKAAVAKLINHPLCHFGASDAGAHITQFCGTGDTTHLLEHYVRETGQMSLERAVHRMTGEVAKDWGIADRGTLEPGKAADLVLFDPDRVSVGDEEFVDDFPGEARRYVRRAEGYAAVIVNGEIVLEDGQYTDARPGQIV